MSLSSSLNGGNDKNHNIATEINVIITKYFESGDCHKHFTVACNFETKIFDWFTTCSIRTHKSGCRIYRNRKHTKACIFVFHKCSSVSIVHSGSIGNQFPTIKIICFISKGPGLTLAIHIARVH